MNSPAIVVALVAAVLSVVTALLTYRSASRANAISSRKVDVEEFNAQQSRYKEMLAEQDRHVERIRTQMERLQDQLAREQDVSNALRNEIRALKGQIDALIMARHNDNLGLDRPGPAAT